MFGNIFILGDSYSTFEGSFLIGTTLHAVRREDMFSITQHRIISRSTLKTGEETQVDCDGVFVSVGRKPATDLVKGQLALDQQGYILAGESTETTLPGVFAVGDVRTKALRQIVTAVSDGAMAAHMAEQWLGTNPV